LESGLPFSDIRRLLGSLPVGSEDFGARVTAMFASQRGAFGGLGDLENLAVWLARWSGRAPAVRQPLVAVFAGTHGFDRAEAGGIAAAAVERIASGKAPVSALCAEGELGLKVFDLALDVPTGDFTQTEALSERDCAATIAFGMESIAGGIGLIALADIGGSADLSAEAVLLALEGADPTDEPPATVLAALRRHDRHLSDPLEILRRVGGRETAAMAGAVLAARMERIPVILDGRCAVAAAAVLHAIRPGALDHCLLARPVNRGPVVRAVERMRLSAVTNLRIDAPGVAAAMAITTVKSAATVAQQMFSIDGRARLDRV
jgi:nicotinate-nucleotide--dimethylbenzimidazole phosphoribosyltransferase